jgi:CO/xanthine dehydrogenase FAD-binding subunit
MAYWTHYHTPATAEEAVALLARYQGRARVIGGGTDLLLEIQQGHRPPVEALIDLKNAAGLDRIVEENGWLVIGAAVTHTQIVNDPRIRRHGTCLAESCGVIGGPQVRNVATLAGNIAHALPAGDGTLGLLALGGELQVASEQGLEWKPMEHAFLGPGKSTIDPTRGLIARVRFRPTGAGEGSAFRRIMRPQGVALPMISMAARLKRRDGSIESIRITLGPAGEVPFVAEQTMAYCCGKPAAVETFSGAVEVALGEARFRDSRHRATSEYRREMVKTELVRTLAKAVARAGGGEVEPEGVGL